MHCLMDVRDEFLLDPRQYRNLRCGHLVDPVEPSSGAGCRCPVCGVHCRQCNGYGGAPVRETPVRFNEVYTKVRAHLVRCRATPPPPMTLDAAEVDCVLDKLKSEPPDHYVHRDVRVDGEHVYILDVRIQLRGKRLPVL